MLKKLTAALGATVLLSLLSSVCAIAGTPNLDRREHNQMQRIRQGVASGELTRPETRRLLAGQAELRRMEARAKRDGEVTPYERARLQHEANEESARIYRQKHDAQVRGY